MDKQEKCLLHCDNQSAIHLTKNVTYHSQTKYIQRKFHWLRERVEDTNIALVNIHIDDNGSDMVTKTLPKEKLLVCRMRGGLVDSPIQE